MPGSVPWATVASTPEVSLGGSPLAKPKSNYTVPGCTGENLDQTVQQLNADGWAVRQIFHEPPAYYRVFAQRDVPVDGEAQA